RHDRIFWNTERAVRGGNGDQGWRRPVRKPAPIVWCWEHRRVADGGPDQPPGRIREAPDRIPCGRWFRVDSQPQPAVPREVFELHGPDEDRGVEAGLRVTSDILYSIAVIRLVNVSASHLVTDRDSPTALLRD